MKTYEEIHAFYKELEIPEYTLHKLKLITPDIRYAKESLDWVSDIEVGRYMGADFSDVSFQGEEERIKEVINNSDAYHWIIECDGQAIGNINISEVKDASKEFNVKSGKLNYLLGDKDLWGKGITTAIVTKVLDWAFNIADFEVIKSRVVPQNKASQIVLEKSGFTEYGKEEYDGPNFGETTWYITYKLVKDNWLKSAY